MSWIIEISDEFEPEFEDLHEDVRMEILALTRLLQQFGPQVGRPRVDTLNDSRHANMKELRFSAADGEWRLPSTQSEKGFYSRFYREFIRKADNRFDAHLTRQQKERE